MLSDLRHKLILCRQEDVGTPDAGFELNRASVTTVLASIKEKASSSFTSHGAAHDDRNRRTHKILIRYRASINLSQMAWLYEERIKSSPRWFKILSIGQTEESGNRYWNIDARLVERSDEVAKPTATASTSTSPVVALPHGVKL